MAHAFVKIEGIPGGSTDEQHKEWIEATNCSHGMSKATDIRSLEGGRGNAGGVQMGDFLFTKEVDKASPHLRQACCAGRYLKKVDVELCETLDGAYHRYMTYTFEKAVISSVEFGGTLDDMSGRPQETITPTCGQVTWAYTPVNDDGTPGAPARTGWDCINNKPL